MPVKYLGFCSKFNFVFVLLSVCVNEFGCSRAFEDVQEGTVLGALTPSYDGDGTPFRRSDASERVAGVPMTVANGATVLQSGLTETDLAGTSNAPSKSKGVNEPSAERATNLPSVNSNSQKITTTKRTVVRPPQTTEHLNDTAAKRATNPPVLTTLNNNKDSTATSTEATTNLIHTLSTAHTTTSKMFDRTTSGEASGEKNPTSRNPFHGRYNKSRPVAKVASGTYLGYWSQTHFGVRYASFSGIRYVKPMTPQNRFKWAELVEDSNETWMATEEGPECPQWNIHRMSDAIVGHEDCLFMNIYTPRTEGRYPVMVVIPCGHFVFDSASRRLNGPDYFMDTQQIVMVIFNYRLGPLGYADFKSNKYPANLGMKDQVLALQWVRRNIEGFGGDPNKVTLQGTSSGAVSVHYHMMSPLSAGLFHGGISESGTGLVPWGIVYPDRARDLLNSLASRTGCEFAVPATTAASADSLAECFRNRTAYQLLSATRHFDLNLMQMLFLPVVEDTMDRPFLPADPYDAPEHPVPWLSGQNSDETGIINPLVRPVFWLVRLYLCAISYDAIPHWLNYQETARDPWNVTADLMYHYAHSFKPDEGHIIPVFKKAGEEGIFWFPHYLSMLKHHGPKYSYIFSYRQTKYDGSFRHPDRGVTHSEEQFYLFIKQGVEIQAKNPPADANMSRTLVRLWVNFVKYFNPTPKEDESIPKWEMWTPENNLHYNFGQDSLKMITDPKLKAYEFWKTLPYRDKMKHFQFYPRNLTNLLPQHHKTSSSDSRGQFNKIFQQEEKVQSTLIIKYLDSIVAFQKALKSVNFYKLPVI